jgi:hypothetical protein
MSDDQPIDAVAFWQSHNAEMDALIEKYIGKDRFEPPAGLDSWFRKQWYINRIRDVMFQAGRCNQRYDAASPTARCGNSTTRRKGIWNCSQNTSPASFWQWDNPAHAGFFRQK